MPANLSTLWLRVMPAVFVLLWSTGFVGAKYGLPYAPPLAFLAIRFGIVTLLLLGWILLAGSPWPARAQVKPIAINALMLHTIYLGGVFTAISWGLEAGTAALIVSVQPLLVAALAGPLLGELVTRRQWIGLGFGLAGVALVVWRKAGLDDTALAGAGLCLVSLISITGAVLFQKRYISDMPLVTGSAIQFAVAAVTTAIPSLLLEEWRIQWHWDFVFALGWLVIVLSLGAMALFVLLIRHGAASRVASLFFLVPPTAAFMAWPLFGEVLHGLEWVGMALVVLGVALVNLRRS